MAEELGCLLAGLLLNRLELTRLLVALSPGGRASQFGLELECASSLRPYGRSEDLQHFFFAECPAIHVTSL